MKLWTTTVEYGASGEGETMMAWIGHAENAAEAKAELIKVFQLIPRRLWRFRRRRCAQLSYQVALLGRGACDVGMAGRPSHCARARHASLQPRLARAMNGKQMTPATLPYSTRTALEQVPATESWSLIDVLAGRFFATVWWPAAADNIQTANWLSRTCDQAVRRHRTIARRSIGRAIRSVAGHATVCRSATLLATG